MSDVKVKCFVMEVANVHRDETKDYSKDFKSDANIILFAGKIDLSLFNNVFCDKLPDFL